MKSSAEINELTAALVEAQSNCEAPPLDGTGQFSNKYSKLASVRKAILPHFHKEGLAVVQVPGACERGPTLTTILLHKSGQFFEYEPMFVPVPRADAQAYASGITYMRRISLLAIAGVVGEEDDDGGEASRPASGVRGQGSGVRKEVEAAPAAAPLLSSARRRAIVELANDLGLNRETMLNIMEAEFSVSSTAQLTPGQADGLMAIMRAQGQPASTSAGGGRSPAAASGGRR